LAGRLVTRSLSIAGVMAVVVFAGCGGDNSSTTKPQPGLCCALDGTCSVTTQADCAGTWTAGGTCTPNGCPRPPAGMVAIPAGTFAMGSPSEELWRVSDETQHQVTLTKPLYVSACEVTQSEWQAMMGWNESSVRGARKPVEQVTWYDAVSYCNKRSTADGYTPAYTITDAIYDGNHTMSATVIWDRAANGYRLLTEAEWEYACRATSASAFCDGGITIRYCGPEDANLDRVGWYCGNAWGTTHDVGGKSANAWGLKDMHGNVWEWCWDRYGPYSGNAADPTGPASGPLRVRRGGGWFNYASDCRSASRINYYPDGRSDNLGLRVALTVP
jgi:formylglycine-generating enzyme required for sulfatase activity